MEKKNKFQLHARGFLKLIFIYFCLFSLSCSSSILFVVLPLTNGPEIPCGRQRWHWHCRGGLSAGKYLATERQSALQRALENCSVWYREYKNEGPNWALCAKGVGEDECVKQERWEVDKWAQQGSMKAKYLKWEGREKGKNIINTWSINNVQGMVWNNCRK